MSVFSIQGGVPLRGRIQVQGSKNSVLPVLAATVLCEGRSVILRCPDLLDVRSTLRVLRHLGREVSYRDGTVTVEPGSLTRTEIPDGLMREMRSSVVFLGAILAREGRAVMSYPGGCDLGPRPIDLHLSSLKTMGVEINEQSGNLICAVKRRGDSEVHLTLPSVGATENIILYASLGNGTVTHIRNAAREPEIKDLAGFINAMGGHVQGAGTSEITVRAVPELTPATHEVMSDRIVAATYLAAAAITGGDVRLEGILPKNIAPLLPLLRQAGCEVESGTDWVHLARDPAQSLQSMETVHTMPYPGFPTDAQAPFMAAAALAQGTTVFVENIFEARFRHAGELIRMGADIQVEGKVAVVRGLPRLYGARVESTDLRGGAALVCAALGAQGETVVSGLKHIDRGYDKLEDSLQSLGANITRRKEQKNKENG